MALELSRLSVTRERESETDRQTEKETDRQTKTETNRKRKTETDRQSNPFCLNLCKHPPGAPYIPRLKSTALFLAGQRGELHVSWLDQSRQPEVDAGTTGQDGVGTQRVHGALQRQCQHH